MSKNVELIKSKIDIVDLVGSYLEIKKSGSNYKGVCPFHNEKSPSFMVNQNLQIYKCFGCGESGDLISFVEKIEGVDFKGAIKILSEKYGIQLEEDNYSKDDLVKRRIYEINNLTLEFYSYLLLTHSSGKKALEYILEKRNLTLATINEFKIGYAPKSWSTLVDFLKKRGYTDEEIISANLGSRSKRGNLIDKFRDRVIFPYFSIDGKCIGFMGRTISGEDPKYLNSSDTPVFKKGEFLYGLYKTKLEIKKEGAMIVEGTMDFLKPYQNGVKNLVATSGTALTNYQLEIIKRYTNKLFFCYDTDNAGVNAILRGIEISDKYDFEVRVCSVKSPYKDLDEFFDNDYMNAQNILKNTIDINDFYLNVLLKKYDKNSASGKKSIVADFSSFYFKITNEITKNHYLKRMSETLNIDEDILKKMLSGKDNFPIKERSTPKDSALDAQKEIEIKNNNFSRLKEASLMAILLRSNLDIIKPIVLELPSNYVENTELRSILEKLQEYLHESEPLKFEISEFLKLLNPDTVNVAKDLLLLDLGLEMGKRDEVLIEAQNLSNFIKKEYLRKQIKQISNQIKLAEKENNLDKVKNLTEEFLNLSKLL
jgi:DNA primase